MKLQKLKPSHLTLILILINTTKMYNLPPQGKEKKKRITSIMKKISYPNKKNYYIFILVYSILPL